MSSVDVEQFKPATIIFFINKRSFMNQGTIQDVYYVIDLTNTMRSSIMSSRCDDANFQRFFPQKSKLGVILKYELKDTKTDPTIVPTEDVVWIRNFRYDASDKASALYVNNTSSDRVFALYLINSMLEEARDKDDEKRAKYKEYLHLYNKIIFWPPELLDFRFYYVNHENKFYNSTFHASQEPEINPVLTAYYELPNYPLAAEARVNQPEPGQGQKDFQEEGPDPSIMQSGVILYRGPKVTIPNFSNAETELTENTMKRYIDMANEFNKRRVDIETQIMRSKGSEIQTQPRFPSTIVPRSIADLIRMFRRGGGKSKGGKSKRSKQSKRTKRVKRTKRSKSRS